MQSRNTAISFQTHTHLWEYLLVAHADEDVTAKIISEKRNFEQQYQQECDPAFYPHIIIANFYAREAMEETLSRWIQNICNLQKSFITTLNNYSALPSSGLYLRVLDAEPFKKLANALKILDGFMESNNCPPLKLVSRPSISFATGLSQYSFDNAMEKYARETFHESFRIDKLVLLKIDAYSKSHLINRFVLSSSLTISD